MFPEFAPKAVARRFYQLFRLSRRHLSLEMKKMGVGAGDYAFIAMLFVRDGQSQDELSRNMQVDKSYTARAVARLEKMSLVERRPDPAEHRIKRVFLTADTRAKEASFFNVFKGWHEVLVKDIPPEELDIILTGMDKMMENARAHLGMDEPDPIYSRKNR